MKNLSLQLKLVILLIAIGVTPLIIYGTTYTIFTRDTLLNYEFQKLVAVNGVKKETLDQFYNGLENQINILADNIATLSAFDNANAYYRGLNERGEKFNPKSEDYMDTWEEIHLDMKHYFEEFEYYDIFLIRSGDGTVLYSATKESDLGAVLSTGPLKDSGLGKAWKMADTTNKLVITDITPYAPSNGTPTSFMAKPLTRAGKKVGIIAIQIPTKLISKITGIRAGLGKTSETYIVGPDYYMRSDSYLDPDNFSSDNSFKKNNKVETEGVKRALAGETNYSVIKDYRGVPVLSAYTPFKVQGSDVTWALLTEVDEEEALEISNRFLQLTIIGTLVFAGIILVIGLIVGRSLSKPIMMFSKKLSNSIEEVYTEANNVSESSLNISHSSTQQASSLEESSASLEEITGMVKVAAENSNEAKEIAEQMKNVSKEGIETSNELTSSMDEILHSNEEIEKLVDVINQIGQKTSVIDEIVFQTKLLSFNASVEAERAGEHGRGFAVVAQEVGSLAEMSGKAAAEISVIVSNSIKEAKTIAGSNKTKVTRGSELAHNTANLFTETDKFSSDVLQKTGEISQASKEQSDGINQINIAISELDKMTQNNVSDVEKAADASVTLNKQVEHLKAIVEGLNGFITGDRANVQTFEEEEKIPLYDDIPTPNTSFKSASKPVTVSNADDFFAKDDEEVTKKANKTKIKDDEWDNL